MMLRSRLAGGLVAAVLAATLSPALSMAEEPKAGVVTAVQGLAMLTRPVIPQPVPVKFKDDVFLRDRIDTREKSVVRLLLGGKALITVRELSVFTVTEEPGRAIVDLQAGKLALQLAKSLMKPGESVEVRTPNAVAAVRGSFIAVEIDRAVEPASGREIPRTTVTVLQAHPSVAVSPRGASAATLALRPNETVSLIGLGAANTMTPVRTITPDEARRAAEIAVVPRSRERAVAPPAQLAEQIADAQVQEALKFVGLLGTDSTQLDTTLQDLTGLLSTNPLSSAPSSDTQESSGTVQTSSSVTTSSSTTASSPATTTSSQLFSPSPSLGATICASPPCGRGRGIGPRVPPPPFPKAVGPK